MSKVFRLCVRIFLPLAVSVFCGFFGCLVFYWVISLLNFWASLVLSILAGASLVLFVYELYSVFTRYVEPPACFLQAVETIIRLEMEVQMGEGLRQVVSKVLWRGFMISVSKQGSVYFRQLRVSEDWIDYANRLSEWLYQNHKTHWEVILLNDEEVEILMELGEG